MINRDEFNNYIVKQTNKYQKKYNFEIGTGKHASWNNEADAFKHAYLSAWLTIRHGSVFSKAAGNFHENETLNAPTIETNMDKWNNAIGREIGQEIKSKINGKGFKQKEIEDMIADKIMQKMNKGELITNPFKDQRKYTDKIFKDRIYNLKNRIYHKDEVSMKDLDNPIIMDTYLDQALEYGDMPTKEDLDKRVRTGELVYVDEYTRGDGTKVSGYYRSYPNS